MRAFIAVIALMMAAAFAEAASLGTAIITQDRVALRASPRDSAKQQAQLWQGEMVEIRSERLDYLQVYDYGRERGGFVRANQVRRLTLAAEEAPELLAIIRFVRETPGSEALGIGLVAAFIQAAPVEVINGDAGSEALDALGTLADRLAIRASGGVNPNKSAEAALSAHLDVAARTASSSPTTSATGVCACATRAMRSAASSQCARRRSSAPAPCWLSRVQSASTPACASPSATRRTNCGPKCSTASM